MMLHRRSLLLAGALLAVGGCAGVSPPLTNPPPIVFVHGDGDSAALWQTTIWRFESNGWPRERLVAIDLPYPLARDEDDKPQPGRSSTEDQMRGLAAEVDKVLQATGADSVVLYGSSRGGNTIRNYVHNGGGSLTVSTAVIGGGTSHGVWNDPSLRPGSEFNGASPFMRSLNTPRGTGTEEVYPGMRWMTLRSDNNDKFAQPDGAWIGRPGMRTNIDFDAPALTGASNVVLPGRDHREVAFHAEAFGYVYSFIAQRPPATLEIRPEERVVLDGKVSGLGLGNDPTKGNFATNLPLAGATVEVHAVDAATGARRGGALHRANIGADGRWGPLATDSRTPLEFVVAAPGYATTHIYRSPFPRSSDIVQLRPERLADGDRGAASVVSLSRPRGYFGVPRDRIELDGASPPAGIASGVAGVSIAKTKLASGAGRAVAASFNGERIVGRAWPAADNHVVVLELHH